MQRRHWLKASSAAAIGAALSSCAVPPPSPGRPRASASTGRLDPDELALLNRVTWGVNGTTAAWWSNQRSRRDALEALLHPPPGAALPAEVQARIDAMTIRQTPIERLVPEMEQRRREAEATPDDDAKKAAQQAWQQEMSRLAREAASRSLMHALYSPHQLREQLAWFWFNHFNVHQYKANLRAMVGDYEDHLRAHALGRFRDLLIASATHAAMIRYLDNERNAVNRVNENYAREVMELHTLGVDGGYTQKDVQELARVLTGLGLNQSADQSNKAPALRPEQQALYVRRGLVEFNPARHDMGTKQLLGQAVAGRGWDEIIEQLTRLSRHPATARHVSRKLALEFVGDAPPPALIDRMARAFEATDGDVAATLSAMFEAPEFAPSLGHRFKDPVHYVVSAVRLAYDDKPIVNAGPMLGWLNRLGEGLYNRQTPDGFPLDEASWASSGQMSTRFEIARAIGGGSAGLFRGEGPNAAEAPAFPRLANAVFHQSIAPALGARTREALDATTSPQEWNAVLLSSPEFMFR